MGGKGKREKPRTTFEPHSHLTTRERTRTDERNETISRLVSAPQPPISQGAPETRVSKRNHFLENIFQGIITKFQGYGVGM